jgi:hypothetical protein
VEILLKGGAYSAQIVLEELNGEKMLEQRVNNFLYIENSELGRASTASLKIRNLAVVQVDYFWHCQNGSLTIDKQQGKMKPSELLDFTIALKPQEITPETLKLELYLYNLPEKSLTGNVVAKSIDGKEAIQCLNIDVKTKPVASQIDVYPLYRRIAQPLYKDHAVHEWLRIANNSSVARRFRIDKICEDEGLETSCSEIEGIVEANSEKDVTVSFNLVELAPIDKRTNYLLSFDNGKSHIFSLEGRSTYPEVLFDD